MCAIVNAIFAFLVFSVTISTRTTEAMPTTQTQPAAITTKQKVAVLSADPCFFSATGTDTEMASFLQEVSTASTSTDIGTQNEDELSDVQMALIKLQPLCNSTRDMLRLAMDNIVTNAWGCDEHTMSLFRSFSHYRWNVNGISGMDDQEVERLKTLVRLSGYILFIETGRKMPFPEKIFINALPTLQAIENKMRMAACQVRKLLPNTPRDAVFRSVMEDSQEPSGQHFMETAKPTEMHQAIRFLMGVGLEDMLNTFTHLDVTTSGIHLTGSK